MQCRRCLPRAGRALGALMVDGASLGGRLISASPISRTSPPGIEYHRGTEERCHVRSDGFGSRCPDGPFGRRGGVLFHGGRRARFTRRRERRGGGGRGGEGGGGGGPRGGARRLPLSHENRPPLNTALFE